jgi:very-short-patch-repair endonuclease
VHTSRVLPEAHVTVLDAIPVTTPTRTLFDLSPYVHPGKLERLVDIAWSRRLTSGRHLHTMLRELESRGRSRISVMRTLLGERDEDYRPPESNLEARVQQLLHDAGYGRFRRQIDSGNEETWLGRMDFRDPELPLVLQVDSDRFHMALVDQRADLEQTAALERAGYVVVRIEEYDVWHARHRVIERVARGREEARRRTRRAA